MMEVMTFQQIADQTGWGRRTVEGLYYRALPKLEMALLRKGVRLEDLLSEDYHQRKVWNVEEAE